MSKILAIRGDEERGNEVIALLEMLGGDNSDTKCQGIEVDFYYYIDTYGCINYEDCFIEEEADFFTLDEFFKKYPYKLNELVLCDDGLLGIITKMEWDCEKSDMKYHVSFNTSDYNKWYSSKNIKCNFMIGKKLAIKGHVTRGKEVIELLEMMGGKNCYNLNGLLSQYAYYFIGGPHNVEIMAGEYIFGNENMHFFTLEEFLEKFPFKVGDFVRIPEYESEVRICKMKWTSFSDIDYLVYRNDDEEWYTAYELLEYNDNPNKMNEIKPLFKAGDVVKLKGCPDKNNFWIVMDVVKDGYIFNNGIKYSFDDQHHYEKTNREVINIQPSKMKNVLAELFEHIKTTPKEELEREFEEIKEWSNVGPTVEEFMTFCESVNKKPVYPKTYDECCKNVLGMVHWGMTVDVPMHYSPLILNFTKLLICRDAYWKIAGEELELGEPWKPKFGKTVLFDIKFYLYQDDFVLHKGEYNCSDNCILVFPTEEIRDTFYENFKDLIEQCKELL